MINKIFVTHAKLLKSLSNPLRLEIIHLLRDRELNVTDIHSMLNSSQSSISQHLKILYDNGVIKSKRKGKEKYYQIKDDRFIKASDLIRNHLLEELDRDVANKFRHMTNNMPIIKDPVCGMAMSPDSIAYEYMQNGKKHYFCASGCMEKFINSPKEYANGRS